MTLGLEFGDCFSSTLLDPGGGTGNIANRYAYFVKGFGP